jgi:predicted ATP-dependent serine protease
MCRYEPAEGPELLSSPRDSSVTKENETLPFTLAGDVVGSAPPEPDWTWDGYSAPGSVTLLAGRPKVGKSTLTFGLVAAVLNAGSFVGRKTRSCGVLLLSEEGPDTFAEKARMFGTSDHPRFHVLLRRQVQAPWPEVVAHVRRYCREHNLGVLVVDTFDKWTGLRGDDENKSGPVLEALDPLMQAAGDGLAVFLVSHQRKAAGDHGEAVRGSNALVGAVDVIVEIERVSDVPHARVLRGTSRFAGTPEELAVELTDDGYVAHGNPDALRAKLDKQRVLEHLGEEEVTAVEVAEATEIKKGTVHKHLNELHDEGRVERSGTGRRNDAFRWKLLSSQPDSLGDERKTGGNGWSAEAAYAFIERAKEMFPGSVELPLDGEGSS